MGKVRLDALLAERGLFPSRSRAAASVLAGDVLLGEGRRPAEKPGLLVEKSVMIAVRQPPPYVSRGGIKLRNALEATGVPVAGRRALDVGASSGGFTDCLLQLGAERVVAVDVGYGLLNWRLRTDPRVSVLERCNARRLEPSQLPYAPDLCVIDVSFISVAKVLAAVLGCLRAPYDCLAMVKPQFEVGRALVGKGGVVRDAGVRRRALADVAEAARGMGASVLGFASSGLSGPKGNRETFVWLGESGRAGAASDLAGVRRLAQRAEPAVGGPASAQAPADPPPVEGGQGAWGTGRGVA